MEIIGAHRQKIEYPYRFYKTIKQTQTWQIVQSLRQPGGGEC